MICEDDLLFIDKEKAVNSMNHFFKLHASNKDPCSIVLLAGNNVPPYKKSMTRAFAFHIVKPRLGI